ncbi:hypothetical protein BJV78DRAFT_1356296 [Lactifluus subvellereus]|nr:hypothetical protein BJV78DRAFT_1356296 [Lactifluus subvellereus]
MIPRKRRMTKKLMPNWPDGQGVWAGEFSPNKRLTAIYKKLRIIGLRIFGGSMAVIASISTRKSICTPLREDCITVVTDSSCSPLITSALANAHIVHPALSSATQSDFTPLSGLFALHIRVRRRDYLEHCNVIPN